MVKNDLSFPLKCDEINPQVDSQDHVLYCKKLSDGNNVKLTQIYDRIKDQQKISNLFVVLIKKREKLLEVNGIVQPLPTKGNILGPSSRQLQQLGTAVL